jgi:hypothetical protein
MSQLQQIKMEKALTMLSVLFVVGDYDGFAGFLINYDEYWYNCVHCLAGTVFHRTAVP